MRKILLLAILSCTIGLHIAVAATLDCRSVVRVISFTEKGDTLQQGYGFFCTPKGEAIVPYSILQNAHRAQVIDFKGNTYPVTLILGASSSYDMVRFQCAAKKSIALPLAQSPVGKGEALQQLYYTTNKKAPLYATIANEVENYEDYTYLTTTVPNEARYIGCPLVNTQGEVVAICQRNVNPKAETACAIDVRFAGKLGITSSNALYGDLRHIQIPCNLPATEEEAFSFLYLSHRISKDSALCANACQLFTEKYPQNVKGYTECALFLAENKQYEQAEAAIEKAFKVGKQKDEVHSTLSEIIYRKAITANEAPYKDWTLERALAESEKAYALRPDTAYLLQQAHQHYALKHYQEAHDRYVAVAANSLRPSELYYYAANSLELAKGDSTQVLALLDSAVVHLQKPISAADASYLFIRAQHLEAAGQYRKAIVDYNDYETAVGIRNLRPRFYDIRQAAEQKARMFQQAIDDLHTAVSISTTDNERGLYHTEAAYIYLQVGMNDEAIEEASKALQYIPEHDDALNCIKYANEFKSNQNHDN